MLALFLCTAGFQSGAVVHSSISSSSRMISVSSSARAAVRMDSSWRPKTVDPMSQVMGQPEAKARKYEYWLDLRTAEITFAQQVLVQLFYAVRRVVDEAGRSLPKGAKVQGLLFEESRYERADTIGADGVPIYVEGPGGLVNATKLEGVAITGAELRAPTTTAELYTAQEELDGLDAPTTVIAISADAQLWAEALTGLKPEQLECLEANEGA